LVRKRVQKKAFGSLRRRYDNIKTDVKEIGYEDMESVTVM